MNQISDRISELSTSQRVLLALKETKAQLEAAERSKTEPIAIIGIGCRLPGGVNDADSFWELLRNGVDAVTELPKDRWDIDAYYNPNPDIRGKIYTRGGGFLQQVDQFDPQFFGISPREAVTLDPQQRLLLEVSWEALENASIAPNQLTGSQTGFFLGISHNDYAKLILNSYELSKIDVYASTGTGFSFAAGRLSHILGLHGPNMAIDTACSSSLVATHLACQSLRLGECDISLAGGVNIILSPEITVGQCNMGVLSPDGRCKTFDASADGYGLGEGCGMIVLKRLSDALADRNHILAVIRGSRVNHDGPSSGLTVPNALAQQALIRQVLKSTKIEPSQVSYVETHGTGTPLGDPIEVRALAAVLGEGRAPEQPLMIGSVKSNIGHLDAAAGIAGLIKVVLSLQHEEIPPQSHFKQPNPNIAWDELPVMVPRSPMSWSRGEKPRIAGVSSFGMSGTNAHVLLEEAPVQEPVKAAVERPAHLLTLSAKTEKALNELVGRYKNYLASHPFQELADICFTTNVGRAHFNHRFSVVASSVAQLREKLAAFTTTPDTDVQSGELKSINQPKVAFLFTREGSQYVDMGRELYLTQPTFRAALERCDEILRLLLEVPLIEVLYPTTASVETLHATSLQLNETAYTQPALFALEYALFELWKSWGITPKIVLGDGVGEYVAACVAGVFSLEDGFKLITERARLMQSLPSKVEVESLARKVTYCQPQLNIISNVTGNLATSEIATAEYWCRHLQQPVKFAASIETLNQQGYEVFVEIGPKPTLLEMARQYLADVKTLHPTADVETADVETLHPTADVETLHPTADVETLHPTADVETLHATSLQDFVFLPSLRQGQSDWQVLLQSLGTLYVKGVEIDWSGINRDYPRRYLALPTYPFQRQRYWVETSTSPKRQTTTPTRKAVGLRHLLHRLEDLAHLPGSHFWEMELSRQVLPYLKDHRIQGVMVLPGTAYLEIAQVGADEVFGKGSYRLKDIEFHEALFLTEDGTRKVQLIFSPSVNGETPFEIYSQSASTGQKLKWILHTTGKINLL
jgi:acyl transferase domain-containing protein